MEGVSNYNEDVNRLVSMEKVTNISQNCTCIYLRSFKALERVRNTV